jgi:hypothetical protein
MSASGPIKDILSQFPGPITIRSSSSLRMKMMVLLGVTMTAMMNFIGVMGHGLHTGHPQPDIALAVVMLLCSAYPAIWAVRGVIQLRYGSLRLDGIGFELAGYLHRRYLWSEVADLRVVRSRYFHNVMFRIKPPRDPETLLNLRFTGGRDACLPDAYGFRLEDLAQLMTAWQSRATNSNEHRSLRLKACPK